MSQETNLNNWLMSMWVCFLISTEVMVKVHVVDLKNETIAAPISVRAYLNQTITEFKQLIAQVTLLIYLYPLFLPFHFLHGICILYEINLLD